MLKMEDYIRPHIFVALRLPSGTHKVTQLKPNQTCSLGKYGSFSTNDLLGRPFYHTYEITDLSSSGGRKGLRIVPASELVEQDSSQEIDPDGTQSDQAGGEPSDAQYEVVDNIGKVVMRTNQNILADIGAQKLTTAEIEELKNNQSASGREIIAKIVESHSEISKKTAFSLAKYTTRKASKYMRRFTPIPMDVTMLAQWWLYEKDPPKIMEIREEMLALAMSWLNIHYTDAPQQALPDMSTGRWLVVDETGGLIVAAAAERLGILYGTDGLTQDTSKTKSEVDNASSGQNGSQQPGDPPKSRVSTAHIVRQETHMNASGNSIHVIHANAQPNLALLTYFGYTAADSDIAHPLHRHLKTLSWVQLLKPDDDPLCIEPERESDETLATWKPSKRGTYHRKRRRWERARAVSDEVRAGGFDGLIICSSMKPISPIRHLVPLLSGGATVVVYSPAVEPLAELSDYFSSLRRSAYLSLSEEEKQAALDEGEDSDFPINPALLLSPTVYTARAKPWQVLPGRTHPKMTGLGGAQGYLFTATRVLPFEGERVEPHGAYKRRKITKDRKPTDGVTPEVPQPSIVVETVTDASVGDD